MIKKCKICGDYRASAAKYQDKKYGIGKRVHNPGTKDQVKCTVCGESSNGGEK